MKAVFLRTCALALAASLAACATTGGGGGAGGAEVTASHLGQPIARGQIAVEAFDAADANLPEFRSYADSVARQLTRLGWTVVNTVGQSEQIAMIDVEQGSRGVLAARPAGGAAAANAGTGAGAGASAGALATLLDVRIRRRSDGTVMWEGRAIGEAGAGAQRPQAVEALATALFRDFPGISGRTIRAR